MQGTFGEIQDAIVALAERVEAIDIRRFESHAPAQLALEVSPLVADLLRDACVVVNEATRACEGDPSTYEQGLASPQSSGPPLPSLPFERVVDDALDPSVRWSVSAVGDIAFLAGLELRQRAEHLDRLTSSGNVNALIGEYDSALRRIRKALTSIDHGFERAGIAAARLDFASELEISLSVRHAYAKLRRRVRAIGEPSGETFYVQLRAIATALATVVGWKGYGTLRVRDRLQMRELQRRLLEWFRSDRDVTAGRHLWQDLDCFVHMLADVSRRQELKEHDARVIESAWRVVSNTGGAVPPSTMAQLDALEGLDDELDALLSGQDREDATAWRAPLARLMSELSRAQVEP